MSTAIRLVSSLPEKSLPRDPARTLAALMSLRFAVNYDWDADYAESIKLEKKAWLNVVGDFVEWPQDLINAFKASSENDNDSDDEFINIAAITYGNEAFKCFVDAYSKKKGQFDTLFKQSIIRLEAHWQVVNQADPVSHNIAMLGDILGLTDCERLILLVLAYGDSKLFSPYCYLDFSSFPKALKVLACMLDVPLDSMVEALHPRGILIKNGIVKRDFVYPDWGDFIDLWGHVKTVISMHNRSVNELMRHFVEEATPSQLQLEDIPHLQETLLMLVPVLRNALISKAQGINILIYGPPGTGKTEFAKLLAKTVGHSLSQVSASDDSGNPINSRERFVSMMIAQLFLAETQDNLILFDEVEEIFSGQEASHYSRIEKKQVSGGFTKAWINQRLESNPIPVIWICNDHTGIDQAFLRRFVFHIEIGIPPRSVRQKIAERYLDGLNLPSAVFRKLSEQATLSPAQLESAARLVKLNGCQNADEIQRLLEKTLKNSMAAMGNSFAQTSHSITPYSLSYLNVDTPLPIDQLVAALKDSEKASLCFYGHPGTGKTELANYIAEVLDQPLLIKRASDLLSPYVGENEANIAAMFKEASNEKAILFLDEADSFLRDRQGMTKGWEVSQVNELLQQMEQFQGIFICATNLFDQLDKAALRRFVFKIAFDYLTINQRQALFAESINLDANRLESDHQRRLQRLDHLTPGDYATVLRQAAILKQSLSADQLIEQLEKESALKNGQRVQRSIGFI
jgi:SpoVK/Ycf46/Vps4 family AAA+-type ATPase